MTGDGYGPGMMMGGVVNNRPVNPGWGGKVWSYAEVSRYLKVSGQLGTVGPKGQTIRFSGADVTIDMVAVQPGHDDGHQQRPTFVLGPQRRAGHQASEQRWARCLRG